MKAWIRPLITRERLGADLLQGVLTAAAFSAFIYLAHWGVKAPWLDTLLGLGALWALLTRSSRSVAIAGFFIGLFWFYWIGFSFRYYNMAWAVPLVSLGFGAIYAAIFGLLALTRLPWLRALILLGITFFAPFNFNWMVPELLFVNSWFGVEKWQFALILAVLTLFTSLRQPWRYALLFLLLGALEHAPAEKPMPSLAIKSVETRLPQDVKWQVDRRPQIVAENFAAITAAAAEGYDMVILSESAFPMFVNMYPELLKRLKEASYEIAIVTGGLYFEAGQNYNVTYLFDRGRVVVAKKMVLVPFGEYIPLPAFLHKIINDTVFDGASDYVSASEPTDFTVRGVTFRNAVCYEATCEELYRGEPRYMIAISNNAWFAPSIEPTLQRLLMRYYARRHPTLIIHVANMGGSGIIR